MHAAYEAPGWRQYEMDWYRPHRSLEPLARETEVVDAALQSLVGAGILPHGRYDTDRFLAHRAAVRALFDIPWTAISPRMERLLYAINAIHQPQVMVAVGIFCGNTFICNAGAAVGPGSSYEAKRLVGLEIRADEAERARRNVRRIDSAGRAEVVAADGISWLRGFEGSVDLLYLDADGPGVSTKSIYFDLLAAGRGKLRPGSLVLAHNSVNAAAQMPDYLAAVRDGQVFRSSMNMVLDDQGLEVSVRA
jgi:predicted O-methyltransferase YrrM